MVDEIKRLLAVKDADGKFVLDADEVAKRVGKHRNSIYESRKGDCKLDKLAIFDKIKELIENEAHSETQVKGNKKSVLHSLDGMLNDGSARYEITIKEI